MNRTERRAAAAAARQTVATLPEELTPIPREQWPPWPPGPSAGPVAAWWSRRYVVQVYGDGRIAIRGNGGKVLEVSWSEIQDVKRAIGFGDHWAVEFYPADADVVDVAPMRWLWLLSRAPDHHLGRLPPAPTGGA